MTLDILKKKKKKKSNKSPINAQHSKIDIKFLILEVIMRYDYNFK
jgi:hypothetical protein